VVVATFPSVASAYTQILETVMMIS